MLETRFNELFGTVLTGDMKRGVSMFICCVDIHSFDRKHLIGFLIPYDDTHTHGLIQLIE